MTLQRKLEQLRNLDPAAEVHAVQGWRVRVMRGPLEGLEGKVVRVLLDGSAWVWMDAPFKDRDGVKRFQVNGSMSALLALSPPEPFVFSRTIQKAKPLPNSSPAC